MVCMRRVKDEGVSRLSISLLAKAVCVAATCVLALASSTGCTSSTKESSVEQTSLSAADLGWEEASFEGGGTIAVPETMEVQAGEYRKAKEDLLGVSSDALVLQQKGLNEGTDEGSASYARIIVEVDYDDYSDSNLSEFSQSELSDLESELQSYDAELESYLVAWFASTGLGIMMTGMDDTVIDVVNGTPCIHYSYNRTYEDNPEVHVDRYVFYKDDRSITLIMSYRIADADYWTPDFEKALQTLSF